MLKRLS